MGRYSRNNSHRILPKMYNSNSSTFGDSLKSTRTLTQHETKSMAQLPKDKEVDKFAELKRSFTNNSTFENHRSKSHRAQSILVSEKVVLPYKENEEIRDRINKIFNDVGIDPSLKPLNLNVQKAFDLISKFSMVAQTKAKPQGLAQSQALPEEQAHEF